MARRFADEGYDVGLLGMDRQVLDDLTADLEQRGATALAAEVDITDAEAATGAVRAVGQAWGRIDVLHFNPSAYREKDPLQLTVPELLEDVALGVGALLTAVQAARPFLVSGSRVSVTGQHGRRPAVARRRLARRAEGRGPQPGPQPRRRARAGRDPGGVGDGARHAGARGRLHARPGGRRVWRAVTTGEEEWASEVPYAG